MVDTNAKLILELLVCPDLLGAGMVTKADQLDSFHVNYIACQVVGNITVVAEIQF